MAKSNVLTRKVGPAPLWAWVAAAIVLYLVYRSFAKGASTGTTTGGALSVNPGAGTNGGGSDAASGQGSAADNLSSGLLEALAGNLVDVNSSLAYALMHSSSTIEGLGTEALRQNGATTQAVIDSYRQVFSYQAPPSSYSPTASATSVPAASVPIQPSPSSGSDYVVSPYYSPAGISQGAGPTPTGAAAYSQNTLVGAGYGSNLSII